MALSYSKNRLFLFLYVDHRPITAVDNLSKLQLQEFRVAANKCQLLASHVYVGEEQTVFPLWDVENSYFTIASQKNRKSSSPNISKWYRFLKFSSAFNFHSQKFFNSLIIFCINTFIKILYQIIIKQNELVMILKS